MTERKGPQAVDEDLDDLRAELVRFVLREAGRAVATDPSLPLSAALVQAIREEAERAVQQAYASQPTAEDLAASVVEAARPELVQIVRATARGEAGRLDPAGSRSWIASMPGPLLLAMTVFGLLVAFVLGFGAAWMLAPQPQEVEPPSVTQPAEPEAVSGPGAGETARDAAAAVGPDMAPAEPAGQETLP